MATKGDVAEVVLDKKSKKKSVKKIKPGKTYKIVLPEGSPLGEGLLKMLEHKKLREKFRLHEITFEEFNRQLREKGINKQYEHPGDV